MTTRQSGQRFGSFKRPLVAKNCCSSAEKTKELSQSEQASDLFSKVSM
jgi:hypothetical protein